MKKSNKILLKYYTLGWNDSSKKDKNYKVFGFDELIQTAYDHGWIDFIMGDDISSIDLQTDEEILKSIKEK